MTKRLCIGVATLLVMACGGGGGGGGGALAGPEEFCDALRVAAGRRVAACQGMTAAVVTSTAATPCRAIGWAAAAGRVSLDDAAAEEALAAVSALTCAQVDNMPEALRLVFASPYVPHVAPGDECTVGQYNAECVGGYCEIDACNAPGTCVAYAQLGEECDTPAGAPHCGSGLYCDTGGESSACVAVGSPGAAGAGCARSGDCQSGLYCDPSTSQCAPRIAENDPCWFDSSCAAGLICKRDPASPDSPGSCIPYVAVGGDCTPGQLQCVRGASCASEGKCREWNRTGGECGPTAQDEQRGCIDAWCDTSGGLPGTCRAFGAIDDGCTALSGVPVCGSFATCTGGECVRSTCDSAAE